MIRSPTILILLGLVLFFSVACMPKAVSRFEVQRPAKLNIDKNIQRIFIDPALIKAPKDQLQLKDLAIQKMAKRLNDFGRFQVIVGPAEGFDPNIETVAVIQGEITSGGEISDGQFTEIATCTGGLAGFAGGLTAAGSSKQGITISRRGLICKGKDMTSTLVTEGLGAALALAGVKQDKPPVDEVVRIYKYKNISFFTQINLSITQIGEIRETIAIRSDTASFGRHVIQPAVNVHETYMTFFEAAPLLITPVTPLYIRRFAVVDESNPDTRRGRFFQYWTQDAPGISNQEKKEILSNLVDESLMPFVKTISPYKELAEISIDESGDKKAVEFLRKGKWKDARSYLKNLEKKSAGDLYNLGLSFEMGAITTADYEDAKRYYAQALEIDPVALIFAKGIGRMERRLKEAKILKKQQ